MTSQPPNIEPALKALADALHGEGPAVELSAGADGSVVVSAVDTPGYRGRRRGGADLRLHRHAQGDGPHRGRPGGVLRGHRLRAQGRGPVAARPARAVRGRGAGPGPLAVCRHPAVGDGPRPRVHPRRPSPPRRWSSRTRSASPRWCPPSCSGCWTRRRPRRWPCCGASTASCSAAAPPRPELLAAARDAGVAGGDHLRLGRDLRRLRVRRLPARGRAGPGGRGRPDPAGRRHYRRRLPGRPGLTRRAPSSRTTASAGTAPTTSATWTPTGS